MAGVVAKLTKAEFEVLNAVTDGLKELREVISNAKRRVEYNNVKTIVFIDEIHRFNKTQQDGLLPAVEKGHIILVGATTFKPVFLSCACSCIKGNYCPAEAPVRGFAFKNPNKRT